MKIQNKLFIYKYKVLVGVDLINDLLHYFTKEDNFEYI